LGREPLDQGHSRRRRVSESRPISPAPAAHPAAALGADHHERSRSGKRILKPQLTLDHEAPEPTASGRGVAEVPCARENVEQAERVEQVDVLAVERGGPRDVRIPTGEGLSVASDGGAEGRLTSATQAG
jgi:hypothetical protein